MKNIKLILASLLFIGGVSAQNFGEIHGKVVSNDNQPVMFATVFVTNGVNEASAYTDEDGKFKIKALVTGEYNLKITTSEYAPLTMRNINVNPDEANILDNLVMNISELGVVDIIWHKDLIKKDNPALIPILSK